MVGSLNGLGGRVDAGENYLAAMRREFKQEAGALVAAWRVFAIIEGRDYRVYCHVSRLDIRTWHSIRTGANSCTIERVDRFSTARVRELAVYPDLRWLIPLALDVERVNAVARIDRRAI
jgi:8-oxo-dGTP diphosphatase